MQQLDDVQQLLRNALLINSISRVKVNNTPLEGSSLLSFEGSNHFQGYQFAKDITQFSLKILRKKGNADITHVLNKESKRDRDSEIVIPENYKIGMDFLLSDPTVIHIINFFSATSAAKSQLQMAELVLHL